MIEKFRTIEEEAKALERERIITESSLNSYKNKLVNEIQGEDIIKVIKLKERKKSFIQKLFSVFN